MTNTTYYNLKKPEDSDNVLISDLNGNADAIDQALHGLDESVKGMKYEPPLAQAGSKSTPADGDGVVITDSADSGKTKRVLWSAVKSALSALFAAKTHQHAAADITSGTLGISRGGTGQTSALSAAKALGRGYGTCSTAAGTAAKTAALSGFSLSTGAVVGIRFTYANTASNPTLNVNSTGAKPIYNYKSNAYIKPGDIDAGMTAFLMYNGTQWMLLNPAGGRNVISGSYAGTDKFGASYPNVLTLGFRPQMVLIQSQINSEFRGKSIGGFGWMLLSAGVKTLYTGEGSSTTVTFSDEGVSWYSDAGTGTQCNVGGITYSYVAFSDEGG